MLFLASVEHTDREESPGWYIYSGLLYTLVIIIWYFASVPALILLVTIQFAINLYKIYSTTKYKGVVFIALPYWWAINLIFYAIFQVLR